MLQPDNDAINQSGRRVNRRDFLKMCGLLAATLAMPKMYAETIAEALANATRLPVIWLAFQDCTGDSESFIKAAQRIDPIQSQITDPSIIDLLLDFISVEYHETLMAPSGEAARRSLQDVLARYPGQFVAIVEGAIPMANNGAYCVVGGQSALNIAREVLPRARAVIATGACAVDGGLPGANPNVTGAVGVRSAVSGLNNYLALPGCPANAVNIVASVVHLITFGELPPRDSSGRPYFAYGEEIHDDCERHHHYENDHFVLAWGDEGHRKGWCLKKMGCKGPATHNNCNKVKWNDNTCWPVAAGHGCIGCSEPRFWDTLAPIYQEVLDD